MAPRRTDRAKPALSQGGKAKGSRATPPYHEGASKAREIGTGRVAPGSALPSHSQSVQVSRRFVYFDASDSSLGVIERFAPGQPDHERTSFALTSTVRLKLSAVELDEAPGKR